MVKDGGGDTSFLESWLRMCIYVHFEFSFGGIFEISMSWIILLVQIVTIVPLAV